MITVCICGDERQMDDPDEQWINQEISRRRRAGQSIWVLVRLEGDGVSVALCTKNCPRNGWAYRPPTSKERGVLELWHSMGLNNGAMNPGTLIAFLKRSRQMI